MGVVDTANGGLEMVTSGDRTRLRTVLFRGNITITRGLGILNLPGSNSFVCFGKQGCNQGISIISGLDSASNGGTLSTERKGALSDGVDRLSGRCCGGNSVYVGLSPFM